MAEISHENAIVPEVDKSEELIQKADELDAVAQAEHMQAEKLLDDGDLRGAVDLKLGAVSKEHESVNLHQQAIDEHAKFVDLEGMPDSLKLPVTREDDEETGQN